MVRFSIMAVVWGRSSESAGQAGAQGGGQPLLTGLSAEKKLTRCVRKDETGTRAVFRDGKRRLKHLPPVSLPRFLSHFAARTKVD